MPKSKRTSSPSLAAATISLSSPSPDTLQWSLPALESPRQVVYTYVDWFKGGVKFGGLQIEQVSRIPDVSFWVNNTGVGNQRIPAGIWDIRVVHYSAVVNGWSADMSTVDNGSFSDILPGVVFN